jgi:hypothetical protein
MGPIASDLSIFSGFFESVFIRSWRTSGSWKSVTVVGVLGIAVIVPVSRVLLQTTVVRRCRVFLTCRVPATDEYTKHSDKNALRRLFEGLDSTCDLYF